MEYTNEVLKNTDIQAYFRLITVLLSSIGS